MSLVATDTSLTSQCERKRRHQQLKCTILHRIEQRGGRMVVRSVQDLRAELDMGSVSMTAFKRAVNSLHYSDNAITMGWELVLVESEGGGDNEPTTDWRLTIETCQA